MAAELRALRPKSKPLGRKDGPLRVDPAAVHPLPNLLLDQLDHELVESFMAVMSSAERATFWRDHTQSSDRRL